MSVLGRLLGRRKQRWEARWQYFPGLVNEQPAAWFVDIGAADAAPVAALPIRLDVEIRYAVPTDPTFGDGLPTGSALNRLSEIEEAVIAAASRHSGVFVGRVASAGECRFTAHLPAEPSEPVTIVGASARTQYDPQWAYVRDHLAPDEHQLHVLTDLLIVANLRQSGDALTTPRPVSMVSVFEEQPSAEAAAARLREQGFEVELEQDGEGDFTLIAQRSAAVVPPQLHDLTWSVREIVERHDGAYGGWHCPVVT